MEVRLRSTTPLLLGLSLAAAILSTSLTAAAADPASVPTIRELPEDWYPESLAAGPDGSLYVGSWRQGAVARVRPDGSAPEILVKPGSNGLANGQGVLVDARAGLLWVCSGALGFTTVPMTPSALKSYNLATGAPRGSYTMPDSGHCNDLAQDVDGTIYVTDSYHPRILKLSPGETALGVWIDNPLLGSGDPKYFLNGIAVDPQGALYVSAVMAVPYVLKVDMQPGRKPGAIHRIEAPRTFKNVDALRYLDANHLVLFESNAFGKDGPYGGAITLATLDRDRITGLRTLAAGLNDPSSGLIQNGRVWYIESKYGLLMAHPNDDPAVPRHVPFHVGSAPLSK
jgi:streptogramin lyase